MRPGQSKLRVNDKVEVITGKDKGRVGKVLSINLDKSKVIVERINIVKKHQKPSDASKPGQIIEKEAGISISNVMIVCPECAETVRVGKQVLEDGTKVRTCKKCKAAISIAK